MSVVVRKVSRFDEGAASWQWFRGGRVQSRVQRLLKAEVRRLRILLVLVKETYAVRL